MPDEELDLDAEGQEPEAQGDGFDALPPKTQAEVKKLRKEAESLRTRLKERDNEVLTAKYGEDIISMIPEEVTTYERRAELAASFKDKFSGTAANAETTQDEAPQASQGDRAEREQRLAAVGTSQVHQNTTETALSAKEIQELMLKDPAAGFRAAQAKYGS